MFGRIWSFVKRHRRKFLITGVVIGAPNFENMYMGHAENLCKKLSQVYISSGAIFLGKYAKRRLLEYQTSEAAECFAYVRRQHHFDSNQRTCNTTVLSLLPTLREALCQKLNSEELTNLLKIRPANKLEIWEELKIKSFTRTLVAVYSCCLVVVYLRVQLNILGGYIYRDSFINKGQENDTTVIATESIRKQYLSSIEYLFDEGLDKLIESIESAVRCTLDQYGLKDSMSSQTVHDVISSVRCKVENAMTGRSEERLFQSTENPSSMLQYLVSSEYGLQEQACQITREERILKVLHNETVDMLQSPDFNTVMTSCLDSGFSHLLHRTDEYLRAGPEHNGLSNGSTGSMPLAKLIPIMNGLVYSVLSDAPNPLLQDLLLKDQVKNFAANVYDAFCESHEEKQPMR